MKLYPIVYSPIFGNIKTVCLCETRADAEEMVLALTEDILYEQWGCCGYIGIENFLDNPFETYSNYYQIYPPIEAFLHN